MKVDLNIHRLNNIHIPVVV